MTSTESAYALYTTVSTALGQGRKVTVLGDDGTARRASRIELIDGDWVSVRYGGRHNDSHCLQIDATAPDAIMVEGERFEVRDLEREVFTIEAAA